MSRNFYRVAAVSPSLNVADCDYNTDIIIDLIAELRDRGVEMAVFPELCITGYTCADLFHNDTLLEASRNSLERIVKSTEGNPMLVWVGAPLNRECSLYNCAVAIASGHVLAVVPKCYIPTYNEFYEKRWWASGIGTSGEIDLGAKLGMVPFGPHTLIKTPSGTTISAEICEDLWSTIPPSSQASLHGAQIIVNLSASDDLTGKYEYLVSLIKSQSARCLGAYIYTSAGFGESSTDLVFDGKCIIAENGTLLACSERWQRSSHYVITDIDMQALNRDRMHMNTFTDCRTANPAQYTTVQAPEVQKTLNDDILHYYTPSPFVPSDDDDIDRRATEIINIQTTGLARRLSATHTKNAVIGISGGLDSTLALLVTVKAFDSLGLDRKGIIGVTMPGFGTTGRTHHNAVTMMQTLGITTREISIVPAVNQHFSDIGHDPSVHDVTYENSQARQRTFLLMNIANQAGGMVIGTGDLSELALGWATYNGDHMSMYGVNAGVPKTLVKYLVKWFAMRSTDAAEREALLDVIDTPISPELIPADEKGNITQKTEDLVGPYELHDFFLYHTLRYGRSPLDIYRLARHAFNGDYPDDIILHWLKTFTRRFFNQQFKRSCMPDGPKVGSVCLSPRGDWRMPSDATSALWLKQLNEL